MTDKQELLRQLPSVDKLLRLAAAASLITTYTRPLVTEAIRTVLDETRARLNNGHTSLPSAETVLHESELWLELLARPTLRPVINATGVIVHTNLGRAPLSAEAIQAIRNVAEGYSTLEYDLDAGQRGSRTVHAEKLLTRLTGAEAALVVNNNAAAVLLMLTGLCQGREVLISRGQLVEIGGGFRVPDVMAQSGAKLVEVGTTNRTHLRDYANAVTPNTAAILVAHHSNFKIVGFTTEPPLAELAELAHQHGLPLLYDQGSGSLLDTSAYGLDPEPTVQAGLQAGADGVAFSGDKLLGGPQAGILVGRAETITRLKKHPLARAVRADKLCLAGLTATLTHYLKGEATTHVPVWQMIAMSVDELERRAAAWVAHLTAHNMPAEVIPGESTVGGGSLPGAMLPTRLVALQVAKVDEFAAALRQTPSPIIGRIAADQFLLDPRTVLPEQDPTLLQQIRTTFLHLSYG